MITALDCNKNYSLYIFVQVMITVLDCNKNILYIL